MIKNYTARLGHQMDLKGENKNIKILKILKINIKNDTARLRHQTDLGKNKIYKKYIKNIKNKYKI